MKKFLTNMAARGAAFLFVLMPIFAWAQSYPSPTLNSLTLQNSLTIANGGTGATTQSGALSALLGVSSIPIANGGTGATSASAARTNLGAAATSVGLGQFASTTSAQLAAILSDETGTGVAVFGTAPTISSLNATGSATFSARPTFNGATPWDSANLTFGVNVLAAPYNAKGDSNGTHGNGTDNTSAFQAAFNAAGTSGGTILIPCGTYRITAPITVTDNNPRWIQGQGACTKIYSDQSTANTTFYFAPSGICGASANQPCVFIANLTFTTPNTVAPSQIAVQFSNTNSTYVDNLQFIGQQVALSYTNSFAPRIHNSRFYGGATGIYSTDISFNAGEIWSNAFYNMTGSAVTIAPASGCAANVSIKNNDFEQNSTGLSLGGICAGSFNDNYIENTHTQTPISFSGSNSSISFSGNIINGATDSGSGSMTISNLTNAQWVNNNFTLVTVAYGSNVSKNRLRPSENTITSATLPVPSVSCTSLGTGGTCSLSSGSDDIAGMVSMSTGTASTGSAGSATVTFTNSLGPNNAACTWLPVNNTGAWVAPAGTIGNSAARASTIGTWFNASALTVSKNYLLAYQCAGW